MRVTCLTAILCLVILITIGLAKNVYSAPDPMEVEEIKSKSLFQVVGMVKEDKLYRDLTAEKGTHYQIRKIVLEISEVKKQSGTLPQKLEVYYVYIPSWQAYQWTGGKRADLAIGDKIEIWLENGEFGMESALGGNTINHLLYVEERTEHIKEPLSHFLKRTLIESWKQHQERIVFSGILLLLIVIFIMAKGTKIKTPF
jgi:hypothetical protein